MGTEEVIQGRYLLPKGRSNAHGASPSLGQQADLFGFALGNSRSAKLMGTLDSINQKYSKGTIKLASEGVHKAWIMKRGMTSPNYTGDWKELPHIR